MVVAEVGLVAEATVQHTGFEAASVAVAEAAVVEVVVVEVGIVAQYSVHNIGCEAAVADVECVEFVVEGVAGPHVGHHR